MLCRRFRYFCGRGAVADESFFIVIEGMDGAGKSSVSRLLHAALAQTQPNGVARTYQPHDASAAGAYIRDVLAKRAKASPLVLAYAFALNRLDHLDRVVNPFLSAAGKRVVICDRYVLSSLVYQSAEGQSMAEVYELNRCARPPDLTLYLNVSPHNCYARMRNRPNDRELFERNLTERAEKYEAGIALLRDAGERIIAVDANPTLPQVFDAALAALKKHGPAWLRFQPPLLLDWIEEDSES